MTKTMEEMLDAYLDSLEQKELSKVTISKYHRDIQSFLRWIPAGETIKKEDIIRYKNSLIARHRTSTVNSYMISLNRYLVWLKHGELAAKTLCLQRKSSLNNIISEDEYHKLLAYCVSAGKKRDYALIRTVAGTGIRVGELKYVTYESALCGSAEIYSKGKERVILFPHEVSRLLRCYCEECGIAGGIIFHGRDKRNPISPKSVWKLLKRLAEKSGVDPRKVYPHSLRHLFAKTYMQKIGNIMELADLLGHSSIETTRIYALTSREEKRESLNSLGL